MKKMIVAIAMAIAVILASLCVPEQAQAADWYSSYYYLGVETPDNNSFWYKVTTDEDGKVLFSHITLAPLPAIAHRYGYGN